MPLKRCFKVENTGYASSCLHDHTGKRYDVYLDETREQEHEDES